MPAVLFSKSFCLVTHAVSDNVLISSGETEARWLQSKPFADHMMNFKA